MGKIAKKVNQRIGIENPFLIASIVPWFPAGDLPDSPTNGKPCSTRPTTYGRGDLTQRPCNQSLPSVFNAKLAFVLGAAEPQVCNPRSSVSNANYHRRSPSLPLLSPLCADDRQKFQSRMLTAGISPRFQLEIPTLASSLAHSISQQFQ